MISIKSIKANVTIFNAPSKEFPPGGYVVARQDITCGKPQLWYYGCFKERERAEKVAVEIRNGVVLEVDNKIDGIKAEIKTEICDYEGCADFNEGIRYGLRTALEIIDKHIAGKEGNE